MTVRVTVPDETVEQVPAGTSPGEIAESSDKGLRRQQRSPKSRSSARRGSSPTCAAVPMIVYRSKIRFDRDLPLRSFELGTVHRHEKSGVLHRLTRVRGFTREHAHILCASEQLLQDEIIAILDFVKDVMNLFGFEYEVELATRQEKSIGDQESWERATQALPKAVESHQICFEVNEGGGRFYAPKINVKLKDALDRRWQCATIQPDFTGLERFDLTYMAPDGERRGPVMLHRVILGFIGVLSEYFPGVFPTWLLALTQVVFLPITDRHIPYAKTAEGILRSRGNSGGARRPVTKSSGTRHGKLNCRRSHTWQSSAIGRYGRGPCLRGFGAQSRSLSCRWMTSSGG